MDNSLNDVHNIIFKKKYCMINDHHKKNKELP